MEKLVIPNAYHSSLSLYETEIAIKRIKDFFEASLAKSFSLERVTAPLFVDASTGLNDNLNGVERPVSFSIKDYPHVKAEVVQSLAKWKRHALAEYGFPMHTGLYTDMNAIRRDEDLDNIHSVYVDQWDYEAIIGKNERTIKTLEDTVKKIYKVMKDSEDYLFALYPYIGKLLPEDIYFIDSEDLYKRYPSLSPKERERAICKEKKAVFIERIGGALSNGLPHDKRAPDYDDWSLNGDILVYYSLLDIALELSSMGIRVDDVALKHQLMVSGNLSRLNLPFQKEVMEGRLPFTIGGGIGESRLCMYYLRKAHIGEVQASLWSEKTIEEAKKHGIRIL